jgi:2'-5' RNA ligase
MRAFFCIELDEAVQTELAGIISRLQRQIVARVTWVPRENLHITLRFLGEIDPVRLPQLQEAATSAIEGFRPFAWQLDHLGAFPHPERPRVLWAGCAKEPQPMQALHAALEAQLHALKFPSERETFTTHVTLGRVRDEGSRARAIAQALASLPAFAQHVETAGMTLMESQLTPTGAIYRRCFQQAFAA